MADEKTLVVGLGASAGGVQAFRTFFEHVAPHSGLAYVAILHLSPEHESHLAEVLQASAPIPVTTVRDRVRVEPNHAYVVSPRQSLAMIDGWLVQSEATRFEERRAPVDIFFRTLAESHRARAACVVLSGSGADGSMGLRQVKERGGACFVQDPDEAEYAEMPRYAIATNVVDDVLPVASIPNRLVAYRDSLELVRLEESPQAAEPPDERALQHLFGQLRTRTGHDFSNYKRATILRRIERRLGVRQIGDLATYADDVRDHPEETQALLKDLLISVTHFFRDAETYLYLEREIVPRLFAGKSEADQIRVWVPGCATGEEAYSLGMILAEHASRRARVSGHPDLRHRHRRDLARDRAGGPLHAERRRRRLRGAAAPVLLEGRRGVQSSEGTAGSRALRAAQSRQGPAVLAPRPRVVPKPAHLPEPRRAGARAGSVALRHQDRRVPGARVVGVRRGGRRPLCGREQGGARLPEPRRNPARRAAATRDLAP